MTQNKIGPKYVQTKVPLCSNLQHNLATMSKLRGPIEKGQSKEMVHLAFQLRDIHLGAMWRLAPWPDGVGELGRGRNCQGCRSKQCRNSSCPWQASRDMHPTMRMRKQCIILLSHPCTHNACHDRLHWPSQALDWFSGILVVGGWHSRPVAVAKRPEMVARGGGKMR